MRWRFRRWALITGFILPMPRLRYRIEFGRWCGHEPYWSDWCLIDLGRRKRRDCLECGRVELA